MPLNEYTWTHEEARLTEAQRKAIMDWANRSRAMYQLADLPK
ncbi:heme-binding domain-containing protein [Robiginitalea sp.]